MTTGETNRIDPPVASTVAAPDPTPAIPANAVTITRKNEDGTTTVIPATAESTPPELQQLVAWFQAKPPRTKVAIIGFASHWIKAPFADPDFEIWSLNEFYDVAPQQLGQVARDRLRWFEIHARGGTYDGNPFIHSRDGANHAEKLNALQCPIYMERRWDDIPMSLALPVDQIVARYGDYYTNSISWMIAMALLEGFQEIHIYGVDMAQDTEYNVQRPSCEYYVGLARGMGRTVYLPPESDLCIAAFRYGIDADRQSRWLIKLVEREKELEGRVNHNKQQIEQASMATHQLMGALEDLRYLKTRFSAKGAY